jgi:MFS family permease
MFGYEAMPRRPTELTLSPAAIHAVADYSPRRRKIAVTVLAGVIALDVLDGTVVNIAIPAIQHGLHAGDTALQWIVAGYSLAFSLLLINAGRLGDSSGYRLMFVLGVAGFTFASALCGLATTPAMLVASRILQGAMAAMMAPQCSALVQILYRPHERGTVMGVFGAVGGAAAVLGPLVGGVLMKADLFGLGWRPIFLLNLPIGLAAIVGGLVLLPAGRSSHPLRPDLRGTALILAALFLLAFPLIEGRSLGWPVWLIALGVAGLPMLGLFAWHVRRRNRLDGAALVQPALFRHRTFTLGLCISLLFQLCLGGFLLILTLLLQDGLGYTPLHTALTTLPFAAAVGGGISFVSRRLSRRLGARLLSLGTATMAAGLGATLIVVLLCLAGTAPPPAALSWIMAPWLAMTGLGMGMTIGPLGPIVLSNVDVRYAGSASGMLSSVQQMGLAAGAAGVSTVFFASLGAGHPADYGHAFARALMVDIVLLLSACGVSFMLPKRGAFTGPQGQ